MRRFTLFFLIWLLANGTEIAGQEIAVIVSSESTVNDLSLSELRQILLGNQQFWNNGDRITILIPPYSSSEGTIILRRIYKMDAGEFRRYWMGKVFRAEIPSAPQVLSPPAKGINLIPQIPGGIVFAHPGDIPLPYHGIKILRINGHLPGDHGYPLS